MSGSAAIFLDRDGTLNESVGYVNHPSRFRLFPWSIEAIRLIRDEGHLAVMVTNQSGVGRGFYSEALVKSIHDDLQMMLRKAGTELDGMYYCPHAPGDDCQCRKPKAGMLERASEELGIDPAASWIVGDTMTDLEAGWSVGARGALVKTGFGRGSWEYERDRWSRQPDVVADDLFRALCVIFWGPVV